ncbi:MAG: phosphatidylserine decarboxylase, partial [Planctomycetota bacterium]
MFKEILAVWTGFLDSEDSRYVLNDGPHGWQSRAALAQLHMQDYQYDPAAPYWGFSSWNDFFTREVKPDARCIAAPDDPKVVVAACDSTVYRVARHIRSTRREFWVKGEPYSLADMLDDEYVDEFIGGDVWQAYLSPFDYHRWHSPVTGTVRKAYVKEGLYFSQADCMGEDPSGVLSEA